MTKEMQDENDLEYILRSSMFNGTMHQNLAYLFGATHLQFKQASINCSPRTHSFQIKKTYFFIMLHFAEHMQFTSLDLSQNYHC